MSGAEAPSPRDLTTRKADTFTWLSTPAVDVWVATAAAGEGGSTPYLVPLSLAWTGERAVVALERDSRTACNLRASGLARLGVGPTRDVTMLDVDLDREVGVQEDDDLADAFAGQADWDPREAISGSGYVFMVLRPTRVHAWREADEIPGRTLMRDGEWTV